MSSSEEKDIMRIYICGPHSSGKTTLIKDLKEKPDLKDVKVSDGIARKIMQSHGWSRDDYLQNPVIFKQFSEETLSERIEFDDDCTKLEIDFISDRALDSIVYMLFYQKEADARAMYTLPGVSKWINRLKKSLVILVYPHAECIEDDGVRPNSSLEELIRFHDVFEQELLDKNIPYIKLTELDREARVIQVLSKIRQFRMTQ